jgi:hypothetical protein
MATAPSPLGVLSIVNGYPKRTLSRPSGRACCFVFRVPVGYWGTPVGPTPAPRPRRAQRVWLHRAALGGELRQSPNDPIARRCRRRRERPERLRVRPFALAANRPLTASTESPAAVGRAGARRCTGLRAMAILHPSRSCCSAAPTGPSRATTGTAALRRTAETENRNSRGHAGRRRSNSRNGMGCSRHTRLERRRCTPPAASQPPPNHPASRSIRPHAACAVGACRRRSPIQRGGRQQPHARRDAVRVRLSAHSADGLGWVLQAKQQRPAFDEVRPPRRARRSAQWCECSHHNTSILGQVLIVWMRALVFFRSNPISANAPQTLRHC